jgi:hypothetical protein
MILPVDVINISFHNSWVAGSALSLSEPCAAVLALGRRIIGGFADKK